MRVADIDHRRIGEVVGADAGEPGLRPRSTLLTGLALFEAISLPPDLTKPISKRPREMTSAVAYSSAMRTGSGRNDTNVPRLRMRAWRV
jgi:hypothetical protein